MQILLKTCPCNMSDWLYRCSFTCFLLPRAGFNSGMVRVGFVVNKRHRRGFLRAFQFSGQLSYCSIGLPNMTVPTYEYFPL